MGTDPYVPTSLVDLPRQLPNLAPGVRMPAATAWRVDRPGDVADGVVPTGPGFGRPGPDNGYTLTLAGRARDRMVLAPGESGDDALAVVGELAMKRAASLGRAPVVRDVEVASSLLGYDGGAGDTWVSWRGAAVAGASHDYARRRALVDAVPDAVLRMPPQVPGLLEEFRIELRNTVGG